MGKSFLETALPIAGLGLGAAGLAGVGPLGGILSGGDAAMGAAEAAGLGGSSDITGLIGMDAAQGMGAGQGMADMGLVFNPSAGNWVDPANMWGNTFVGNGSTFSKMGNFLENNPTLSKLTNSDLISGNPTQGAKLLNTANNFMRGGQPQQGPKNVFSNVSAVPRQQSPSSPGSFTSSANTGAPMINPQTGQPLTPEERNILAMKLGSLPTRFA